MATDSGGFDMNFLTTGNMSQILLQIRNFTPEQKADLFKIIQMSEDQLECMFDYKCKNNLTDNATRSYEEEMMEYGEFRLHRNLLLFVPPIMLMIGSIGNLLSFVILTRKSMRRLSTYTYLAVLSMTDILVLYVGLLRLWVGELTGTDIRVHAAWICKVVNVLGYTVSDYSVWLIIAMTVERWIAVCMPLKAPSMCNRKRAVSVVFGLFGLLLVINLHFCWTTEITEFKFRGVVKQHCDSGESYKKLHKLWPWVDAIIYSFLPFVVIITLNGLIIHKVILSKKKRTGLSLGVTRYAANTRKSNSENSMKLTFMLLCISFTFLVTTLPMNIWLIVRAFNPQNTTSIPPSLGAKLILARTITELLMYVNHSMNFFLYCATGEKFRQQLILLLCPKRARRTNNVRWQSDFSQCCTEKTALNGHRVQAVRTQHGPCKTKNCPLAGATSLKKIKREERRTGDDVLSPVVCRMEIRANNAVCKMEYSRVQEDGDV